MNSQKESTSPTQEKDDNDRATFVIISPNKPKFDPTFVKDFKSKEAECKTHWIGLNAEAITFPGKGKLLQKYKGMAIPKPKEEAHESDILRVLDLMQMQENLKVQKFPCLNQFLTILPPPEITSAPLQPPEQVNVHPKGKPPFFKRLKCEAQIIAAVMEYNNLIETEGTDWRVLWASGNLKPSIFENIQATQKINHFPGSTELTHKDRLAFNIRMKREKFGEEYDILPETFILPEEYSAAYNRIEEVGGVWISKPYALSQGRGIHLIDNVSQLSMDTNCIISRYISNPLLINDRKFDLRIYVLITSYQPLRIYVYNEGLTRFAAESYTQASGTDSTYAHLTNYSLNKKCANFIPNVNIEQDDQGHKWSLSALFRHLASIGVDITLLWSRIYDVIVKTVLSVEDVVLETSRNLGVGHSNCFELLGFDILIDSTLKPWLIEVNLSPSLACDSPLDFYLKSNMVAETLNLACIHLCDGNHDFSLHDKAQVSSAILPREDKQIPLDSNHRDLFLRLKKMVPRVRKALRETIIEGRRKENYIRIYPTEGCTIYDKYFNAIKPINKIIYGFLYNKAEMVMAPVRTFALSPQEFTTQSDIDPSTVSKSVPPNGKRYGTESVLGKQTKNKTTYSPMKNKKCITSIGSPPRIQGNKTRVSREVPKNISEKKPKDLAEEKKVLITGDDILIEYVTRLSETLSGIREDWLDGRCADALCRFVENPIWRSPVNTPPEASGSRRIGLQQRIQGRLADMKMRYNELQNHVTLNQNSEPAKLNKEKTRIIRSFASEQLENILLKSARNSKCGAIESLFLSISPPQGILSYLQRQFGRIKVGGRIPIIQTKKAIRQSKQEGTPQGDSSLCALPSISETKTDITSAKVGQTTCRSLTSRSTGKCSSLVDKNVPRTKERRASFGNTITRLRGMLGGKQDTEYSTATSIRRNEVTKVGEVGAKMFGTFRSSNAITNYKTSHTNSKYASLNTKKVGI